MSLLFLLLAGAWAGAFEINPEEHAKAPEFALKDLNDELVSITALRGKVVVLNFWATWCPPCKDEIPSLNQLYRDYKDKGLEILAVSLNGSKKRVMKFQEKYPMHYPTLMDKGSKVSKEYKVYSIPTTFIIDKAGFIVRKYQGEEDWVSPKIIELIEELLK